MAQLNITLNQDEILQSLADDRDSAFKQLLQDSLNSILGAESADQSDSFMVVPGMQAWEFNWN